MKKKDKKSGRGEKEKEKKIGKKQGIFINLFYSQI